MAIIFWIFNTLSASHTDVIDVHLHYAIADNKINTLKLPEKAEISVEARGWDLLKELFLFRAITIDLVAYTENNNLLTNANRDLFNAELPSTYHVLHIHPDTLHLRLDEKVTKKVPVLLDLHLPLPGSQSIDSIRLQPDSIYITGAKSVIDAMINWPTERINITKPDTVIAGIVPLKNVADKNIELSAVAVAYAGATSFMHHFAFNIPVRPPTTSRRMVMLQVTYDAYATHGIPFGPEDFMFSFQHDSAANALHVICIDSPPGVQNIKIEPALINLNRE